MVQEWSDDRECNPFNSSKLYYHIPRWKHINSGKQVPAPAIITIDPINVCNLRCTWCNSDYILKKNHSKISRAALQKIADYLPQWNNHPRWNYVEAVCIAGGGEPTLHPHLSELISNLTNAGIEVGVVTNGIEIPHHLEALAQCTWVGVSVDAASEATFKTLKDRDYFTRVIDNMGQLIDYSRKHKTALAQPGRGPGVAYKYLLHPKNVHEVLKAAEIAKEIGCKSLHIRPAGDSWDKLGSGKIVFSVADIAEFQDQITAARKLEEGEETFGIYGITHKFDGNFKAHNAFTNCYSIFMTAVFMPPSDKSAKDSFNFGLCCDRRGDRHLTLENLTSTDQVREFWGGKNHWQMFAGIDPKNCPRCTYQPHNKIFKNTVLRDNMTFSFA